jgi:hypothetical protein
MEAKNRQLILKCKAFLKKRTENYDEWIAMYNQISESVAGNNALRRTVHNHIASLEDDKGFAPINVSQLCSKFRKVIAALQAMEGRSPKRKRKRL